MPSDIVIGPVPLTVDHIGAIARREARVSLSDDAAWRGRIEAGACALKARWEAEGVIYGVTTGYGDSCTVAIPMDLVEELPRQLTRFHGCGLGAALSVEATRAVIAVRLASLARGMSGVRLALLERLVVFLAADLLPIIPEEGSVGASGDLTPLSYLAAALIGERDVTLAGTRLSADEAHRRLGIAPLVLRPKEGLAIMNGTAVMTALAALAWRRADRVARQAARVTALTSAAIAGNPEHFDPRLFEAKPHPGPKTVAAWIASDLAQAHKPGGRVQDRYSVRCAPHVIGVLVEALGHALTTLNIEIAGADDNPLVEPESGDILHGGNFYGGHVAFVMDGLKAAIASVADLLDRQVALLTRPETNGGLPANLSGAVGRRAAINHGFKAVAIATSAWTAEALKATMPAASFSRSTENHNQDKVPMGTIAARDCLRVLQLTEQVTAAAMMAASQGIALRRRMGGEVGGAVGRVADDVLSYAGIVEEDRPLEGEIRGLLLRLFG